MSLQDQIDQEIMLWQLAAFAGQTEKAKEHQDNYMKLVLQKVAQGQ